MQVESDLRSGRNLEFYQKNPKTLSDAIDITGPIKPLSGKVVLIRYNSDGSIATKKISYSATAPRGSKRNPYLKEGDLITIKNSVLGKTTGILREITEPLQGIYFTKELIEESLTRAAQKKTLNKTQKEINIFEYTKQTFQSIYEDRKKQSGKLYRKIKEFIEETDKVNYYLD